MFLKGFYLILQKKEISMCFKIQNPVMKIAKAHIPKGTKYLYSSESGEYISEQIFIKPIFKNKEKYVRRRRSIFLV